MTHVTPSATGSVSPLTSSPATTPSHRSSWHAHLSAVTPATAAPQQQQQQQQPARRVLTSGSRGSTLDRHLVGVPLVLRRPDSAAMMTPDGKRVQWVLHETGGGGYTLAVAGTCGELLTARSSGKDVCLAGSDDGSGLQQWALAQVGDSQYRVSVAGGKADDKVHLGTDDDGSLRLFSKANDRSVWSLEAAQKVCQAGHTAAPAASKQPAATPSKPAAASHVPPEAIRELPGFTEKGIDTILQLISLPENGHPKWYKNYNYAEFLGDGRGFTVTLYGACSGTGDLHMIFEELAKLPNRSKTCDELLRYKDVLKKKRGDDIKGIEPVKDLIHKLGDDPAWQRAVWKVYVALYWNFANEWASKSGSCARRPGPKLTTLAARGFMLDCAINHGANYDSVMYIVKRMKNPDEKDEVAWITDFAEARRKILKSGYQDLDTSKTGDRCGLWAPLFKENPSLKTPFKAGNGYWGNNFTIQ